MFVIFLLFAFVRAAPTLEGLVECLLHLAFFFVVLGVSRQVHPAHCSGLALLVVGALCCQYSTAQGAENCIERVIVDLVLAQVTLSGMGLDPISIGIWTLISLGLCFGLCSSELVAVPSTLDLLPLLVPLCLLAATSIRPREPEVEETSEEKKPEVKVQQCLKLVLQQLRVPLQLALHEGADGQLLQQRIQQIWQLLAGLDQQLEQHFTDRVLESLGSASKVDLVLGHRSDWWRLRGEHEFRRVSTDGSRVSPAMKESPLRPEVFEVSTSIGSGAHWEVLPDAARLELEVDLERDGMPVTEVKYLLPESQGEEIFLHNLCEDWENFRNWFEPEVNRCIHGNSSGESISCAFRPPFGTRMNGLSMVTSDGSRLRLTIAQLTAEKT